MKKIIRNLLLLGLAGMLASQILIPAAAAQEEEEPIRFSNVQLWVYPEYDDPGYQGLAPDTALLVMLEGTVVGTKIPAVVSFLVPSTARMYSAGSKDAQGQYTGGPPQREPSETPGWDRITYVVTTPVFRVEYYDPIIVGSPDKSVSYEFRWLYPIDNLQVIVQEPAASSDFTVTPAGVLYAEDTRFVSYSYNYTGLDDDPPLKFDISYTKSDTRPSLSIIGGGSAGAATTGGGDDSGTLIAVIVAVVAMAGIFGVFLWMRRPKPQNRAARRQLSRTSGKKSAGPKQTASARPPSARPSAAARYCTQCGQPVDGSYRFCPNCGKNI